MSLKVRGYCVKKLEVGGGLESFLVVAWNGFKTYHPSRFSSSRSRRAPTQKTLTAVSRTSGHLLISDATLEQIRRRAVFVTTGGAHRPEIFLLPFFCDFRRPAKDYSRLSFLLLPLSVHLSPYQQPPEPPFVLHCCRKEAAPAASSPSCCYTSEATKGLLLSFLCNVPNFRINLNFLNLNNKHI